MLTTILFNLPYAHVKTLLTALLWMSLAIGAVGLALAVAPFVLACCAAAAPVVGQTLVMIAVVAGYAAVCRPRPRSR